MANLVSKALALAERYYSPPPRFADTQKVKDATEMIFFHESRNPFGGMFLSTNFHNLSSASDPVQ